MSDSNDWIHEVNGKVDHGIMAFDIFETNEVFWKQIQNMDRMFCKPNSLQKKAFKKSIQSFYTLKKPKCWH